jgi:hypothetical protein
MLLHGVGVPGALALGNPPNLAAYALLIPPTLGVLYVIGWVSGRRRFMILPPRPE